MNPPPRTVEYLRSHPEYAHARGVILDQIAIQVGQVPDLHPHLLDGIESAAALLAPLITLTGEDS